MIPILESGLKSRVSDAKRMGVQIVGNMASLTDSKDFVPHLDVLLPLVHRILVDPVPDVRGAAAKSLGTLVERLGENTFPDLVSGLLQTLRSESSAIDRQGAAQGLSEVLSGLGMERMEGLLPQILENARSPRPFVREGFMSLLVFLPITFGQRFAPYLGRIVQPILDGLSDVEELVRAASIKAGRIMINNFSNKATDLLLPHLQKSLFDESARIRVRYIHCYWTKILTCRTVIFPYFDRRAALQACWNQWQGVYRRGRRSRNQCRGTYQTCSQRSARKGPPRSCLSSAVYSSTGRCELRETGIITYLEGTRQ